MKLFYFCMAFLVSVMAMGTTIYVPDDYGTIQAAIDASSNGDLILVEADTYTENIDFLGKAITVRSEDGPATTVIDGGQNGSVVTFDSGEDNNSIIDGFTITNGNGTIINVDWVCGGGIYCDDASPRIINNIIADNTIISIGYTAGGGLYSTETLELFNCIFYGNSADYGGGVYTCGIPTPWGKITNCTFYDNDAIYGGGICCCLYAIPISLIIVNTILYNNTATYGHEVAIYDPLNNQLPCHIDIGYSDIDGGELDIYVDQWSHVYYGVNNIDSDPLFIDESGGDFHILYTSPCKDAGDNSSVTESYDFEGDPRITYSIVDMGADEFYTHLYLIDDTLYFVGVPNLSVNLYFSYILLSTPISIPQGIWYLGIPFYGPYYMGNIPANGVLTFEMDTDDLQSGSLYLQALIGNKLTNYCELIIE